jgi:carboxypeptidase C (cathepsin A)
MLCYAVYGASAGESYAGAYIPWMADHIVNEQIDADSDTAMAPKEGRIFINLKGI